jgi:hypothetical protein
MGLKDVIVEAIQSVRGRDALTPADISIMGAAMAGEDARLLSAARAEQAYLGEYPDTFKRDDPNEPDHNIKVNRIGPIIDHSVFYLFGKMPDWEIPAEHDGEGLAGQQTPLEDQLATCLEGFNFAVMLVKWAQGGGLTGDAYLRVHLPHEEGGLPYLRTLDGKCMSIVTDPRDHEKETGYVWQYNSSESVGPGLSRPRVDQQLVMLVDGVWRITDRHSVQGGPWVVDYEEDWPYPWCPVIHNPNLPLYNSCYGLPDANDNLIDLNVAQNRALSNRDKILWHHSHPVKIAYGMAAEQMYMGPGDVIIMPGPDSKIEQLTPSISGTEANDLVDVLYEAQTEQSHTPSVAMGKPDDNGVPSGVSLTIKFTPIIMKTELKRMLYGPSLQTALQRLLHIMTGKEDIRPALTWRNIVPSDPKADTEIATGQDMLGVSKQTTFAKLGLKWEEELKNKVTEQEAEAAALAKLQAKLDKFRQASDVPTNGTDAQALELERQARQGMPVEMEDQEDA